MIRKHVLIILNHIILKIFGSLGNVQKGGNPIPSDLYYNDNIKYENKHNHIYIYTISNDCDICSINDIQNSDSLTLYKNQTIIFNNSIYFFNNQISINTDDNTVIINNISLNLLNGG